MSKSFPPIGWPFCSRPARRTPYTRSGGIFEGQHLQGSEHGLEVGRETSRSFLGGAVPQFGRDDDDGRHVRLTYVSDALRHTVYTVDLQSFAERGPGAPNPGGRRQQRRGNCPARATTGLCGQSGSRPGSQRGWSSSRGTRGRICGLERGRHSDDLKRRLTWLQSLFRCAALEMLLSAIRRTRSTIIIRSWYKEGRNLLGIVPW